MVLMCLSETVASFFYALRRKHGDTQNSKKI
nr:MAG TPA: hypothetical protein [Caudoviricetes sp.]